MRLLFLFQIALLASCSPPPPSNQVQESPSAENRQDSHAEQLKTLSGKVVGCHDGDTIKALINGKEVSIRLEGIDAPELGQPFGRNAKEALSNLVFGKVVQVKETGKPDRYGRMIARIFVDSSDINLQMISQGFAWHFVAYSKAKDFGEAEHTARKMKAGLWADDQALPPWDWSKSEKKRLSELKFIPSER